MYSQFGFKNRKTVGARVDAFPRLVQRDSFRDDPLIGANLNLESIVERGDLVRPCVAQHGLSEWGRGDLLGAPDDPFLRGAINCRLMSAGERN